MVGIVLRVVKLVFVAITSTYIIYMDLFFMLSRETKVMFWFIAIYICFNTILYITFPYITNYVSWFQLGWSQVITLFVLFIVQEIILFYLLYIASRFAGGYSFTTLLSVSLERSCRKWRRFFWKYVIGWLLCYFTINALLLWVISVLGIEIPGLYGEQIVVSVLSWLEMSGRVEYAILFTMVAIVGPLVEEVLFRGFMTHSFMKEWKFKWVILASLVFAAVHTEWAVVRNLVILSLFLGYIYWKTESIWYSFLFHVIINGFAVLALIIASMYPEAIWWTF